MKKYGPGDEFKKSLTDIINNALMKSIGEINIALLPTRSETIPANIPPAKVPISFIDKINACGSIISWLVKYVGIQNSSP